MFTQVSAPRFRLGTLFIFALFFVSFLTSPFSWQVSAANRTPASAFDVEGLARSREMIKYLQDNPTAAAGSATNKKVASRNS